ncbi:MAG: tandem-95 repeat protein, partial [Parachlamydiaceae bacterium]|nr:tandem-95 repeat protein [Parachlamydiaceae bacterium]
VLEDSGLQTVANFAQGAVASITDEQSQTFSAITVMNNNNGLFFVQPSIDANGTLTYTPAANANGSATVTVTLTDSGGTANGGVATITNQTFVINVTAVNDAPVLLGTQTVLEDSGSQTVVGFVNGGPATATDEQSQTFSAITVMNNNNGLFSVQPSIDANGTLTYTPAANANGSATVTVTLTDSGGTANGGVATITNQTFVINVTAVNDALVANNGAFTTDEDVAHSGILPFIDVDGDTLAYSISTLPSKGTVTLGANGSYTYTPNANANGSDSFVYKVDDGHGDIVTGTITVTITPVNDAPVANNDSYSTYAGSAISNPTSVLTNDTDVDTLHNNLTTDLITGPSHGTVTLNSDGTFNYTPTGTYVGSDSFTYTVNDHESANNFSNIATVNISVNQAPISATPVQNQGDGSTPGYVSGLISTFTDPNHALTSGSFIATINWDDGTPTTTGVVSGSDGNFSISGTHTYSSSAGGNHNAQIHIVDVYGSAADVAEIIGIPVTNNDTYSDNTTSTNRTITINASQGVLSNDAGINLTAKLFTGPSHGSLTLNSDGSFSYTANAGYSGPDSFKYQAIDSNQVASYIATANITDTIPANIAPTLTGVDTAEKVWVENKPATKLVAQVRVTDLDNINFNGGKLTAKITQNASSFDRLGIVVEGTLIKTSGPNVIVNGVTVGTYTIGVGINPLVVTFNASSNAAIVEIVLKHVGFSNTSDNPTVNERNIQLQLTDGKGGTSNAINEHVRIISVNDAPVIHQRLTTLTVKPGISTGIGKLGGLLITDIDANANTIYSVSLNVKIGTLAISKITDLRSLHITKTTNSSGFTMAMSGKLTDINAALSRLTYISTIKGTTSLTIHVNDNQAAISTDTTAASGYTKTLFNNIIKTYSKLFNINFKGIADKKIVITIK